MRRDYDFGSQLGKGSFGVVFRVRRKSDGGVFVCKELELQSMSKKAREEANQEVSLLRKVSSGSEYIVQYIASFLEDDRLHIIMEFCERGDLSGFVKERGGKLIEEMTVWRFLIQIGLGLRWLHKNRILHRDIKTMNVFLTSTNDARLGDLGVARVLSHNTNFAETFVGTPYYLSPELCEDKPYNELSDVWAFGCVVYELCTLRHPFEAKNQAALLIKILRGQFAPVHERYSGELRSLIDGCMRRDWMRRTKLVDLLASSSICTWAERTGVPLDCNSPSRAKASEPKVAESKVAAEPKAIAREPPKPKPVGRPVCSPPPKAAPRARDRRVGDRRAGGGRHEDQRAASATRTLIAAPASRAAAQVVRNAPARIRTSAAHPPPQPQSSPQPQSPPRPRKSTTREEERRRAAREVAELPDVVLPRPTGGRNVPSVHQLLQLEPEPAEETLLPQRGEETLRPPEVEAEVEEELVEAGEEEEEEEEATPGGEVQEEESLLATAFTLLSEDSLAYTVGDTLGFLATGGEEQGASPEPSEVTDAETLQPGAKLDSDGLLCDAHCPVDFEPMLVEPVVRVTSVEPADAAVSPGVAEDEAAPAEGTPAAGAGTAEEEELEHRASNEPVSDSSPSAKPVRSAVEKATAKVARLTAQISRLYTDVIAGMDERARLVWEELYRLFQTKMSADLTDEDQCEIERYVFERLPTESTDLIWKVYKVLHLEQERDRCQKILNGSLTG